MCLHLIPPEVRACISTLQTMTMGTARGSCSKHRGSCCPRLHLPADGRGPLAVICSPKNMEVAPEGLTDDDSQQRLNGSRIITRSGRSGSRRYSPALRLGRWQGAFSIGGEPLMKIIFMGKHHSLSGKRILVLGASVGIGLAVAGAAREQGAEVLIVSSRKERLDRALKSLPTTEVAGQVVDLSNEPQVQALFEGAGEFDHLVFTAGEKLIWSRWQTCNSMPRADSSSSGFGVHSWRRSMVALISGPEVQSH